jgi:tetratricopeptide (TPR) repeat protein
MPTFNDAYYWLNNFVEPADPYMHLSFTANELRGRIEALAGGPTVPILVAINKIILFSEGSTDPFERAEIRLVCARSYFYLGYYNRALNQLDAAGKAYLSDSHNQAVVFWMTGCVLMVLGNNIEALQLWQRSLDKFTTLATSQHVQQRRADWYQGRCIEMMDDINANI